MHGVVGFWMSVVMLVFLISGLSWPVAMGIVVVLGLAFPLAGAAILAVTALDWLVIRRIALLRRMLNRPTHEARTTKRGPQGPRIIAFICF